MFSTPVVVGTTAGAPLAPVQFTQKGTFTYDCGVHGMMMIGQIPID
jgi:plastocyanin